MYDMKYESIKNKTLDTANFRKSFLRNYVNTGIVANLNEKREKAGKRPTALYALIEQKERDV